jgi:dihydrofolate reductase
MRKVITGAFISLDGVMQAPGGPEEDPTGGFNLGGWVVPYMDEVFGEEIGALFGQPFDLLLGRKTYEIFAAHWPFAEGGQDDFIARRFNSVTKYVATRSSTELTWKGSVALHDAGADVGRLKAEDGAALVTQGSSDLIQTLLAKDLVDEIWTFTFPIVLGQGKKLFGKGSKPAAFRLTKSRVSTKGVSIAHYERAGEVVTGDFAMDPPTAAEIARRNKMKMESSSAD